MKIKLALPSLEVTNILVSSKMMKSRRTKKSRKKIRIQSKKKMLKIRIRSKKMAKLSRLQPLLRIPMNRKKKMILKSKRPLQMKMKTMSNRRGSRKAHGIGLKKTRLLNVTIVSSLVIWLESVLMKPKDLIAFSAAQTRMTPSIALKRCVSNATKLVTKRKIVRKRTSYNVVSAIILAIVRQGASRHGQLRVQA